MTQAQFEHSVLQDIGLIVTLAVVMAAGFYAWLRKVSSNSFQTIGNVGTEYFGPNDILGALFISLPFTLNLIAAPTTAENNYVSILTIIINFGILLLMSAIVLVIFAQRKLLPDALGLKPKHPAQVVTWAVGGYIVFFVLTIILNQVGIEEFFIERLGERQYQDIVNDLKESESERRLVLILGACVIAPFAEEIIFRGYLYPVAKKYTEPFVAAIFTGVLFGAIHGEIWAVLPLSLFGILLAVLYEYSGSIWACILCHGLFNTINVFFMVVFGDKL